jgi:TorA maturation chaperone TorD
VPADLIRALGVLAEAPTQDHAALSEALGLGPVPPASEYADLFVFNVYPYASVHLGAEGQLGGEARSRVAGFWNALGVEVPAEPDHLTSLLGLFAGLTERAQVEEEESRRMLLEQAVAACLFEHLLPWTGTFLRAARTHGSAYYSQWADLLSTALTAATTRLQLEESSRLPVHLAATEAIRLPGETGGSAFLEQLLAPVRTGMVISRQDMARLGRDVGLGARIGERRYMLEAYLGQDPHGTLEWMTAHAESWTERPDEHLPLLREFWETRALSAVTVLRDASLQAADFGSGTADTDESGA